MTLPSVGEDRYSSYPNLTLLRLSSVPYYIKETKKIPKTVKLENEVYVRWANFELPLGTVVGKRLVIAGTGTASTANYSRIFFAVFNTYYNMTEFLWEEPYSRPEVCRAVEIAKTSDHCNPAVS